MRKSAERKIISLLLAITVALGVIPFTAVTRSKAANETYSTEDFEYVINSNNTIRIIKCINTTDEVITIPEEIDGYTVKSVYPEINLFPSDNTTVKRLNIPKTVTYVATDSLIHSSLEYINVDKENTSYTSDENGILYSKNYTELLFCPKGLQSDEIVIPDSVTGYNFYNNPFKECKKIKRIVFPRNATSVCYDFSNCTALEYIEFPETTVTSYCKFTFYGCKALKSVDLSNFTRCNLESLAFQSCSSLEAVTLSPSITDIPDATFNGCSQLKSIDLLNSVSTIGTYAFLNCTSLSTVSGLENVQSVGVSAFGNCSSLTQISFGEKLDHIGTYAFRNCTSLSDVSVPSSKIEIEPDAFLGTQLVSDTSRYEDGGLYLGTCLISVLPDTSFFTVKSGTLSLGNSAFATQKKITSIELPDSLQYIGDSSFAGCSALESIVIPDSVTEIGYGAFRYSGIKEIVIPDSVKSLGEACFENSKLESITLPETGIELGSFCFKGSSLKVVTLPADIKSIPYGMFNSTPIETITVPESVTLIGTEAFKACKKLERISLPNVQDIKENAFSDCTSLKEIGLSNSLTKIGRGAFTGCESLASIFIPKSVTSIGDYAFNNYLKTVYFEGTKAEWEAISFGINNTPLQQAEIIFNSTGEVIPDEPTENIIWSFDSSDGHLYISGEGEMYLRDSTSDYEWYSFRNRIKSVTVEDEVTSIASNAFLGFENLREISLSEGVKSIGINAFANCPELSLITFNGSPESIASGAFSGCSKHMTVIGENGLGKDFAETNGFNYIPVSFDSEKKILGFGNTLTIYKNLPYAFIVDFVLKYSQAEYLHFDKLVFDGVIGDTISIDNVDPSANYLTLNNLYVSLKSVDGEQISFAKMLELLENGDYNAFKYVVKDDSGEQEEPPKPGDKNFFEKLSEQFDKIITGALKTLSKVANFFRKLFK